MWSSLFYNADLIYEDGFKKKNSNLKFIIRETAQIILYTDDIVVEVNDFIN